MSANVVHYLERAAERAPNRLALVMPRAGEGRFTFRELFARVNRYAAGLRQLGVERGDRVIVMIPMSPQLYAALLGVLEFGAVAVFVDPWVGARQIARFSAFAAPKAFLGVPRAHLLRLGSRELRRVPIAITTGGRFGPWPARASLTDFEGLSDSADIAAVGDDDPALITFTTGSSGTPKGALRTHGFLRAQHEALASEFPYRDGEVDQPMFPVFALNNLASAVTSVIPDLDFKRVAEADGEALAQQLRAERVTTITASPPYFDRLVEHLERKPGDRPPLRRILTGGAPVTDRQIERWRAMFPRTEIQIVYGSTEAEPVAHVAADERLTVVRARREEEGEAEGRTSERPLGFLAGLPTARLAVKVIRIEAGPVGPVNDWSAWELPRGEVGELVVSGDHVGRSYFRNPEAERENKIDDAEGRRWHRMGDTGYLDGEGRFWLVGRVHSTWKRGDDWVHPQLYEQVALADDRVTRAAAVGVPSAESVKAKEGASPKERALAKTRRLVLVLQSTAGDAVVEPVLARLDAAGLDVDEVRVTTRDLPVDPRHNSKVDYGALALRLERGRP